MGYYARHNVWYSDCCKGKYKFDEESTGDAGRDLCDVCDMPLPSKDIPIGEPRKSKPVQEEQVEVSEDTLVPLQDVEPATESPSNAKPSKKKKVSK